jgi:AcrR family transcriptional regulator
MAETDAKSPAGTTGDPAPARRGPGRPPGRRAGTGETRTTILDAARTEFAARGYAATSVRAIARGANVDPALVHHYFGSKSKVFIAAMELPIDPDVIVERVFAEGPEHAGARLAATFLGLWEELAARERLLAMLRTAVLGDDNSATREFVTVELTARLAERIGTADAPLRANLAVSQLLGIALTRHVLCLEPIASTPRAEIEARIAPVLQRHLDGGPRVA